MASKTPPDPAPSTAATDPTHASHPAPATDPASHPAPPVGNAAGPKPVLRPVAAPGTEQPRRFVPRLRYELLRCATSGHELIGTDAARILPEDAMVARQDDGARWHRCLRCDSWLPIPAPEKPAVDVIGPLADVEVPLRGRPLRDRYVLRLIALDRAFHVLVLGALAVVIFLYASHHSALNAFFDRVLKDLQGGVGGPVHSTGGGISAELKHVMAVSTTNLYVAGALVAAYALLEGVEMVGLWTGKRWAEYLTFLATIIFIPYEIYELARTVSWLKALTLAINVAIAVYLLLAKRLFGLRGGGAAEAREHERDTGWPAVRRASWWLNAGYPSATGRKILPADYNHRPTPPV